MTLDALVEQNHDITERYRGWLAPQPCGDVKVKHWSARLQNCDAAHLEGAIAEAVVWDFLRSRVTTIALADNASTGGPDFLCQKDGNFFYVEVTNISREQMTKATHIKDVVTIPFVGGPFRLATKQIVQEVRAKAKQFSKGPVDHPLLVFVTTLHGQASRDVIMREHIPNVLFDDGGFTSWVDLSDANSPQVIGSSETYGFSSSICSKKKTGQITRLHISGVIVGGFGDSPTPVLGVLHPEAVRAFDPRLLPDVPFATVVPWPLAAGDSLEIKWSDG